MYHATFADEWKELFDVLEKDIKDRVLKKIPKILEPPQKRHLKHGVKFFVVEISQFRIAYRIFDNSQEVRFYFVGLHKDYEKLYKKFI